MLGKQSLTTGETKVVYTTPSGKRTVCNLGICNRGSLSSTFNVAIVNGYTGVIADEDYIEFSSELGGKSVFERTGIVLDAGDSIVVVSGSGNISVSAWGYEETI
jgi:hypothetical protein